MNDYEESVQQQIHNLTTRSLREIEAAVIARRVAWHHQHPQDSNAKTLPTPRIAFERLFFDYMGLSPEDLTVVEETAERITWLSTNPCPTLDACLQLGLDTRRVCRAAYEKSTQAFVSQIDPQLRFHRSYTEIRPYAGHCLETIVRVDFGQMMRLAIAEAQQARQGRDEGYGAVVVYDGRVLASARDTAEHDPSQHAEVNALRQAVEVRGDANLSGAVLFSTCEPCPMCASLAVWANVTTIVYGASIEATARLGKSRIGVSAGEIVAKSPVMVEVIGNVLAEDCLELYR